MINKTNEIQRRISFICKNFTWEDENKQIIENLHKLLKAYEGLNDILYYDIQEDYNNKKIKVIIKIPNESDMIYLIEDDGK